MEEERFVFITRAVVSSNGSGGFAREYSYRPEG